MREKTPSLDKRLTSVFAPTGMGGERPDFDIAARQSQIRITAALFLAALTVGWFQAHYPAGFGFGTGFEMPAVARNLVKYGTYGNPFHPFITGPTAAVPPLYPLIIAGTLRFSGDPVPAVAILIVAYILVNAMIAGAIPHLSKALYGSSVPGVFSGVLWIATMPLVPQWDVSYTVAILLLFCLLTARSLGPRDNVGLSSAAAGVAAGMLILLNPATVLIFIPWVAFLLFTRRPPFEYAARYCLILAVSTTLCIAPWIIRNYLVWQAFVLRTNFGMTVFTSNNSCAASDNVGHLANGCYFATHPNLNKSEANLLRTLGEVRYDRLRIEETSRWIRDNPGRFLELTKARFIAFWFPHHVPAYTGYAIWVVTLLSVPGLVVMLKHRQPATYFVLFVWFLYPLMYYVVLSDSRYRYPLLWTSLLPAGYLLAALPMTRKLVHRCK